MSHPHWPFFDLRLRTERLELRLPTDDDLPVMAALAAAGIHDADTMPFDIPWTDAPPGELERSLLQWHWRSRAELSPESWRLGFAVVVDGEIVGTQDLAARDFPAKRVVFSGSWLGRAHQGRGIGKEMRAMVLHLAFNGLDAAFAESAAFHDNAASIAVSRGVGYEDNGFDISVRRGRPGRHLKFLMSRDRWLEVRAAHPPVGIEGLAPCLPLLGLTDSGA